MGRSGGSALLPTVVSILVGGSSIWWSKFRVKTVNARHTNPFNELGKPGSQRRGHFTLIISWIEYPDGSPTLLISLRTIRDLYTIIIVDPGVSGPSSDLPSYILSRGTVTHPTVGTKGTGDKEVRPSPLGVCP